MTVAIMLETECCQAPSVALYEQLSSGHYDLMSVLPVPFTIDEWKAKHRTAGKRAARAERRGYFATTLLREHWSEAIYKINISADFRQGRPMSDGYRRRVRHLPLPDYPCPRHAIRATGVWSNDNELVAYLVMIRAGELALVSQILGHWAHLENEIMYLLFQHGLEREINADPDCLVVYNRHDSGTDGLRFFKERLGFRPVPVEWLP